MDARPFGAPHVRCDCTKRLADLSRFRQVLQISSLAQLSLLALLNLPNSETEGFYLPLEDFLARTGEILSHDPSTAPDRRVRIQNIAEDDAVFLRPLPYPCPSTNPPLILT